MSEAAVGDIWAYPSLDGKSIHYYLVLEYSGFKNNFYHYKLYDYQTGDTRDYSIHDKIDNHISWSRA